MKPCLQSTFITHITPKYDSPFDLSENVFLRKTSSTQAQTQEVNSPAGAFVVPGLLSPQ